LEQIQNRQPQDVHGQIEADIAFLESQFHSLYVLGDDVAWKEVKEAELRILKILVGCKVMIQTNAGVKMPLESKHFDVLCKLLPDDFVDMAFLDAMEQMGLVDG